MALLFILDQIKGMLLVMMFFQFLQYAKKLILNLILKEIHFQNLQQHITVS